MASPREAAALHPGMAYMPALDGVRAIAVVAVLAFHAAPRVLPGGFFGVDVFFVLSGYLITSVIVADRSRGRFSLGAFYLRRVQRLLPNLVATLLGTLALFLVVLPPSFAVPVARHGIWVLANLSNVYIWQRAGNYWSDAAHSFAFLHTWSLAVEEQFYLVLPAVLLAVRRPRAWIAALAFVSATLAASTATHHPAASFYLLPMRAWEPLLGALAALSPRPRLSRWIAPLCLVTLALAFAFVDEFLVVKPFEPMLVAGAALGLVLDAAGGEGVVCRLLATAPMTWVGRLSYSLYLWHWPLVVLFRDHAKLARSAEPTARLWGTAAGIALGIVAYYAVERPFRRRTLPRRTWLPVLGAGFATCLALTIYVSHRPVERDPFHLFEPIELLGNAYTAGASDEPVHDRVGERYADVRFAEPIHPVGDAWRTGGIVHAWGEPTPEIVVLGSSHALMYSHVLDELCRRHHVSIAFLAVDGTSPFVPSTTSDSRAFPTAASEREFDAARLHFIGTWHPKAVFVIDRWSPYLVTLDSDVRSLLAQIAPLTSEVVLFGPIPGLLIDNGLNLREYASWRFRTDHRLPEIAADDPQPIARVLAAIATGTVHVLPLADLFTHWREGRTVLYADNNHLSEAGALRASARIEAEVVAAKSLRRKQ